MTRKQPIPKQRPSLDFEYLGLGTYVSTPDDRFLIERHVRRLGRGDDGRTLGPCVFSSYSIRERMRIPMSRNIFRGKKSVIGIRKRNST